MYRLYSSVIVAIAHRFEVRLTSGDDVALSVEDVDGKARVCEVEPLAFPVRDRPPVAGSALVWPRREALAIRSDIGATEVSDPNEKSLDFRDAKLDMSNFGHGPPVRRSRVACPRS